MTFDCLCTNKMYFATVCMDERSLRIGKLLLIFTSKRSVVKSETITNGGKTMHEKSSEIMKNCGWVKSVNLYYAINRYYCELYSK